MLTMEKRSEIGILKTMGTTPGRVALIFVLKGLAIGVIGLLWGWITALAAAYLQNRYGLISLPADIYFVNKLPVDVHFWDFAGVGGITIFVCFLAAIFPAYQAARVSVIDVLRQ